MLSFNAMMAATTVVAPVEAHVLALDGLALLEQTVALVSSRRRAELSIGAIIPCRVSRTRLAREVVENLRERFGKVVTTTVIRENIKLAEAPSWHQSIQTYAPDSHGAADYSAVSGELLRSSSKGQGRRHGRVRELFRPQPHFFNPCPTPEKLCACHRGRHDGADDSGLRQPNLRLASGGSFRID